MHLTDLQSYEFSQHVQAEEPAETEMYQTKIHQVVAIVVWSDLFKQIKMLLTAVKLTQTLSFSNKIFLISCVIVVVC